MQPLPPNNLRAISFLLLAFLAGLGIYGCYLLLTPFLSALAWALAFAVVGSPLHNFLERRVRNAQVAAGLSVAIVAGILVLPALLASEQIIRQAIVAVQFWSDQEPLEQFPVLQQIDVEGSLRELAGQLPGMLRSSMGALTQLPVSVFCLFFFFRDRKMMADYARSWLPLSDGEVTELSRRISDILFATILGRVTLAGIQGTLGGVMFLVLGLPTPLLWGLVMAFLALIPFVGASLVWGPAAAYLVLSGSTGKGLVLALWGLLVVSTVDNVLYPFLVGARVQLHPLVTFFGVLGGLALFGPAGLILGPVILATTSALLEVCRRRAMALGVAEPEGEVAAQGTTEDAVGTLPESAVPQPQEPV